jgi:tetratricopeptide (TPR) repeat protein
MKLNHPIAARAAAELAARFAPSNDSIRKGIATVFGKDNPNLPPSATQMYTFKPRPAAASAERQAAWDSALKTAATGKLVDATKAFEQLTQGDQVEAAAWFNLALCQAWSGNNATAVTGLDRYVALEPDETAAAQAWALAEVLRFGQGMEDQASVVEYSIAFGLRDPRAFVAALGELEQAGLLTGTRVDEQQGVLTAIVLDPPPPALTPELQAQQNMKVGAYVALMGNYVRLWHTQREALDRVFLQMQQKLGANVAEPHVARGPAKFLEMLSEAISFPRNALTQEDAAQRMRSGFEKFYEEQWINRPLKSIGNLSPADAVAQPIARKKLRGVLQVMGECCTMAKYPYDFNRLLGKLGLIEAVAAPAADKAKPLDIAALGAVELAGLQTESLSAAELDLAYQTAAKLDARELAGTFAAQLVERPPYPERPDRFALYQLLINQTMTQGKTDESLDYLNDGERDDCENNEGRRRNEYELRRAQVHAKRGEFEQAQDVYDRLIARVPTELNYRINAAETMLSAREKTRALKFAQDGAAAAVKQNNRDLEGHFKELMAAAKR